VVRNRIDALESFRKQLDGAHVDLLPGTIALAVPQLREGTNLPEWLLEPVTPGHLEGFGRPSAACARRWSTQICPSGARARRAPGRKRPKVPAGAGPTPWRALRAT